MKSWVMISRELIFWCFIGVGVRLENVVDCIEIFLYYVFFSGFFYIDFRFGNSSNFDLNKFEICLYVLVYFFGFLLLLVENVWVSLLIECESYFILVILD